MKKSKGSWPHSHLSGHISSDLKTSYKVIPLKTLPRLNYCHLLEQHLGPMWAKTIKTWTFGRYLVSELQQPSCHREKSSPAPCCPTHFFLFFPIITQNVIRLSFLSSFSWTFRISSALMLLDCWGAPHLSRLVRFAFTSKRFLHIPL